jgi:hypothetical protein
LEEKGFDFVFHDHGDYDKTDNAIYHSIDEAPYIEKLSEDSKKLKDFALRFGLREENNQLCKLHNFMEEPEWMIMFDGSVNAQTVRPNDSHEYEWQEYYAENIENSFSGYGRNLGFYHDITKKIDEVLGGNLGNIALDIMDKDPFVDRLFEKFWEQIWDHEPIVDNICNPYYLDDLILRGFEKNKLNPYEGALNITENLSNKDLSSTIRHALEHYDQICGFHVSSEIAIQNCIISSLNLMNSDEN